MKEPGFNLVKPFTSDDIKYQILDNQKTFAGPVHISCFEGLHENLEDEVGRWLDFMDLDHRRLGCVNYDPVGQFYRKKEAFKL